jgi:hypothetical protein
VAADPPNQMILYPHDQKLESIIIGSCQPMCVAHLSGPDLLEPLLGQPRGNAPVQRRVLRGRRLHLTAGKARQGLCNRSTR